MKILMVRLGAIFEKKANWQPSAIADGRLVTEQNPASSTIAAHELLNLLAVEKAAKVPTAIDAVIDSAVPRSRT